MALTLALTLGLELPDPVFHKRFHKCVREGCKSIVSGPRLFCMTHAQQSACGFTLPTDAAGRIGPAALCAAGDKCTHILNSGYREVRASHEGREGEYCSRGCRAMSEVLDQGQTYACGAYALAQALIIARQRNPQSAAMTLPTDAHRLAKELWSRSPINPAVPAGKAMYTTYPEWQRVEARKYGMEVDQLDADQALGLLNTNSADVVLMTICCSEARFYHLFRQTACSVSLADCDQASDNHKIACHQVLCLNQHHSGGHASCGFMLKNSWGAGHHFEGKIYVHADVVRLHPDIFTFSVVRPL